MDCNNTPDPCGCQIQLDSSCVFYNSDTLACINATSGSDLETILKNLNTIICDLNPTNPIVYEVKNTDGTIVVIPTGTTLKSFNVSVSPSILNAITNLQSSVFNINTFLAGLTFATTTPGITGSWLGNKLTVNYTPTVVPESGGIIYNNASKDVLSSGVTNLTVKRFSSNLLTDYNLSIGDVLRLKATFEVSSAVDPMIGSFTSCFLDINSAYKLNDTFTVDLLASSIYSYDIEMDVCVVNTTLAPGNAVANGRVRRTLGANGQYSPNSPIASSVIETACTMSYYLQLDWSAFVASTGGTNSDGATTWKNNQMYIELIKIK